MVDNPGARRGGLLLFSRRHQIRTRERVESPGGPSKRSAPRIPTEKIPYATHIKKGEHTKLYRFSPSDYLELAAVFNGAHPETGEDLVVIDDMPDGVAPFDLPAQEGVFAPDYAPEEIAEIARKLRKAAGLADEPTGVVANDTKGVVDKVKKAVS